uniref:Uncharacterized protein n=1 Tax=Agrobacterium tumefaciens TaxID=358 RepID=A0A3Q8ARG6_AGRTU|nr:hypothetical protein AgrTiEU6_11 [Agrobacterium tumefaciens]
MRILFRGDAITVEYIYQVAVLISGTTSLSEEISITFR